jgi:hypothetical protein
MALTVTLAGDWLSSLGNKRASNGTLTFDSSYATGGESLTPANIGLGVIDSITFNQGEDGYVFKYIHSTQKVQVFRTATVTPTGSVAVTEGAVTVKGGGGGEAMTLNPDSTSGVLTKAAATDRVIPRATLGFAASTAAFTGAPTTAAALAEVGNAVDLSAVVVEFMAVGT